MGKQKIVFFAISPVDSSFLLRLIPEVRSLIKIEKNDFQISILLLVPFQQYSRKQSKNLKKFQAMWKKIGISFFHFPVKILGAGPLAQLVFFPLRIFFFVYYCLFHHPDIVHAHSIDAGFIAALLRPILRYRLVLDLHGAVAEEIKMRKTQKLKFVSLLFGRIEEYVSIYSADGLIYVSMALKSYVKRVYRYRPGTLHIFAPCSVIINDYKKYWSFRTYLRKKLNLDKKFVTIFSGGFYDWQEIKTIVRWFKLVKLLVPESFLLVLTNSGLLSTRRSILEHGLDENQFRVLVLPFDEMPRYVSVADMGLIGREKAIVNHVSSPLKFSVYLASGVPVLANRAVDQIVAIIEKHPMAGFLLQHDSLTDIDNEIWEKLKKFLLTVRSNRRQIALACHASAMEEFDWKSKIKTITKMYYSVLSGTTV